MAVGRDRVRQEGPRCERVGMVGAECLGEVGSYCAGFCLRVVGEPEAQQRQCVVAPDYQGQAGCRSQDTVAAFDECS